MANTDSDHGGPPGPATRNPPALRPAQAAAGGRPGAADVERVGDDVRMAQADGGPPTLTAAGAAPGESGLSVLGLRFDRGLHFEAVPQRHLVWLQLSDVRMTCRRGGHVMLEGEAPAGSVAICPAGLDAGGDARDGAAAILVSVQQSQLALAAADAGSLEARLMDRTLGADAPLFELGRVLARESASGHPNGALFWHDAASAFVDRLVARHSAESSGGAPRFLSREVLRRLRDYVMAHLGETIAVGALAAIAGRSPFHFSRSFTRCVGVSPHRYVVHLRLKRAVELVREGRSSLAEVAADTGFADQSHLSRWIRQVYGASLATLAAPRRE